MQDQLTRNINRLFAIVKRIKNPEWLFIALISIGLGLFWFLILYGRYSLYFTHVYWIYSTGRDPLQHQLGWEFFRGEPWHFPLGTIKTYGYPIGTTVTFMDSIPLFAFIFKLLSPWLEKNFQYFGFWELTSIIFQMAAGMLVIREFTKSYLIKILGASLLILSPPMIYRAFFHSSLTAHWIILLAILFVILEYRQRLWQWCWLILFTVAMLVHLYYIPMLFPLWIVSNVYRYRRERNKWIFIIEPIKIIALISIVGYCTGIFSLSLTDLSQYGLGEYSWNLNGFINSFDTSKFVKPLPYLRTQQEGYSYLGLGSIILSVVAVFLFPIKDSAKKNWKFFTPIILICLGFIIISLSDLATFNKFVLWEIKIPDSVYRFFSMFRSTGRFIWPVFYFIVLFALLTLVRNCRRGWTIFLLISVLIVQYLDLQPLVESKRVTQFVEYDSSLKSDFWQVAGEANKSIQIIPTEQYDTLAIFAVRHHMTLSSGYFGRADNEAMEEYSQTMWRDLLAGKANSTTLYIFSDPNFVSVAKRELADKIYVCLIDGYNVVFSKDNSVVHSDLDLSKYCSIPFNNLNNK